MMDYTSLTTKSLSSSPSLPPNTWEAFSVSSIAAQHVHGNLYAATRNPPLFSGKVQY
jgi:hypothetical protein